MKKHSAQDIPVVINRLGQVEDQLHALITALMIAQGTKEFDRKVAGSLDELRILAHELMNFVVEELL